MVGLLALVAATSCVPTPPVGGVGRLAATVDDHRLLRQLALADPLEGSGETQREAVQPTRRSWLATDDLAAAPPFAAPDAAEDDRRRAAECLTAAIYYEARSEPLDGQRAVAQVVLNRVRDRAFPDSVCKVVYQRAVGGGGCQFSFVCDGSMAHALEPRAWQIARDIALAALGGAVFAPVGAATHYHTDAILPWWASSLTRIGSIGSHIFYRWRDRLADALSFRQAYSGVETIARGVDPAAAFLAPRVANEAQTSVEAGVTVHRGLMAVPAHGGSVTLVAGVRIHHGEPAASEAPSAAPEPLAAAPAIAAAQPVAS